MCTDKIPHETDLDKLKHEVACGKLKLHRLDERLEKLEDVAARENVFHPPISGGSNRLYAGATVIHWFRGRPEKSGWYLCQLKCGASFVLEWDDGKWKFCGHALAEEPRFYTVLPKVSLPME